MRCHECSRPADLAVGHEGVRVGLCQHHFAERLAALSDDDRFARLAEELDG